MDYNMEIQLNHLIADTIWSQISGKFSRGEIFSHGSSSQNYAEWGHELKKMDFAQNPERAKVAADYFLSLYQKMGQKILDDPSFVLNNKDLDKNWEQLLSPEALAVRAIEDTIQQMVETEPSLKQNLQEYLEAQIREQIEKGNKALEIGYLFTKEPFSPENRAYKKYAFDCGEFSDELVPQIKKAIVALTDEPDLEEDLQWTYHSKNNAAIGRLYIEEPNQTNYRLKKVIKEEIKKREIQEADLDESYVDNTFIVEEKDIQDYFKYALNTLQEDEYEKDPALYAERLIKMQLLESHGLISDPAAIDAFEKEKQRIFHLSPNEKVLEALAEKKRELFQKRGEPKLEDQISIYSDYDKVEELGEIDHQILALERLTKGSREYELIEAETKDWSAYPYFQKEMQEYQSAQTEEKQKEKKEKIELFLRIMGTAFMKAFENLDFPERDDTKNYRLSTPLRAQILDGIKNNLENLIEEKRQEQLQEQMLQENEQKFNRHISKEDLDDEISPLNVDLALTVNKLATSVRKGAFGEKKDNSREYDKMVQTLAVLLEDPTWKEPTLTQKENIERAYEVCQDYVVSHKNAKTAEGKNRLNLAKESLKILAEMNPELKERQKGATQNRERISFHDLENGAGRNRHQTVNAHREKQKEVQKDRKAGKELRK